MRVHRVVAPAVAAGLMVVAAASPAGAAINDNFSARTTDGCGVVDFVDFGPGAEGGGDNDDYLVIRDTCGDFHGVKAYAWIVQETTQGWLNFYLGGRYNGDGVGSPVIWDPYKAFNPDRNVARGDVVALKVCLVDGNNDATAFRCGENRRQSADG